MRLQKAVKACGTDAPCLKRMEETWRSVLEKYPRSFLVRRAYSSEWPPEIEAAHKAHNVRLLESAPRDPLTLTLRARDIIADQPNEALGLLEKALEVDPGYAWAHFTLAWHYQKTDKERARPHVVKLAEACPDTWRAVGLVQAVGGADLAQQCARTVRQAAPGLPRDRAVRAYENLWNLAFRGVPPTEHDAVREQVRTELAQVASWRLEDSREWWQALEKGYELVGDTAARDGVRRAVAERYPCETARVNERIEAWNREHPTNSGSDRPERTRDRFAFSSSLVSQCPDNALAWVERLAAAEDIEDLPDEEVARIVDGTMGAYSRGDLKMAPSPYLRAADLYLERGIRLERVASLIECDRAEASSPDLTRVPEAERARFEQSRRRQEWSRLWRRTRAEALQGASVDATLAELERQRDDDSDADERAKKTAWLAWLRGDRAAGRGHWADTFAFYSEAEGTLRLPALSRLRAKAWRRAGGTPDGLAVMLARTKPPTATVEQATKWESVERRLPQVKLSVVGAQDWGPDSLEGRRTFVNVWATWCGPCVKELPLIQKLHERIMGRKDIGLLTLNADDNSGLVEPFLRENKYTFPVVYAAEYLEGPGDVHRIPANWIVDESATVRLESFGFGATDGDRWLREALDLLEKPLPSSGK